MPLGVITLEDQAAPSAAADRLPKVPLAGLAEAEDQIAARREAVVDQGNDRPQDFLVARQQRGGLETR